MRRQPYLWAVVLWATGLAAVSGRVDPAPPYVWNLPRGFPQPRVPATNPMSEAKAELGRHLFYDTRLSENGTQSCATCHEQERAFTDGRAHAVGSTGEVHPRGSMSLVNVAYAAVLTWGNPTLTRLEDQALVPMFGEHPVELGLHRPAERPARPAAKRRPVSAPLRTRLWRRSGSVHPRARHASAGHV